MGSTYVKNKMMYEQVGAYATPIQNTTIPSGATLVEGIYYIWDNDAGFTNSGWYTDIDGSPTNIFDFSSYEGQTKEQQVTNYVNSVGNLDAVFENWSNASMEVWNRFYLAVPLGCKERVYGD